MDQDERWGAGTMRTVARRRLLVSAGLMSGAAAFAAACGGGGSKNDAASTASGGGNNAGALQGSVTSGTAVTSGQAKKGGTYRSAGGPLGAELDIHKTNTPYESSGIWHWAGNFLMRFNKDGLPDPDLATAQPEITDGGTTLTFKLNPAAKWQQKAPVNGRALDSEDVKFTFERIRDPKTGSPRAGNYANLVAIETPDKNTVVFKTKAPEADLLAKMSDQYDLVVPKEWSGKDKPVASAADVVGTGPYVLENHVLDQGFKLSRRPDGYWKPNISWMDGWDFRRVDDPQAQLAAYRANQVDVVGVPGDSLKEFEADKNSYILRRRNPTREAILLNLNKPLYKDVRVRQAIWRAVDRQAIYDKVFGGLGLPSGPMTPAAAAWVLPDSELVTLPGFKKDRDADIKDAKQLLAAAGYPDGFDDTMLTATAFNTNEEADLYVPQMQKIGIRYKIENVGTDFNTFLQREIKRDYSAAATLFLSGPYPDAQLNLYHKTGASRNYADLSDPKLDEMLDAQSREFDVNKRKQLVLEIQRYLIQNPGQVWVGSRTEATAYKNYVKGIPPTNFLNGYFAAENGWLDK